MFLIDLYCRVQAHTNQGLFWKGLYHFNSSHIFIMFSGFTRLGRQDVLPKGNPKKKPEDPVWLKPGTSRLPVTHFTNEPCRTPTFRNFNPFQNKPLFLCVCSTTLLKTLEEKEKLLITSNFSFSYSILDFLLL